MTGGPYSKERQLSRGERRYRRKVASPKQWQAIIAAKGRTCRCREWSAGHLAPKPIEYHHLVPRGAGGDDTEDNIVPLCCDCHYAITVRVPIMLTFLAARLTDSERAYVVGKLGEDGMARLFGATR